MIDASTLYSDGRQIHTKYDPLGRMLEVHSYGDGEYSTGVPGKIRKVYDYEHSGAVDFITFTNERGNGPVSHLHEFTYDPVLRRIESTNQIDDVTTTYSSTDRGQLKTESLDYDSDAAVDNPLLTTTYDYDEQGRLKSVQYPDLTGSPKTATYGYDNRGLLKTVHWPNLQTTIETRSYDAGGRLVGIDRPTMDESRAYDEVNRLTSILNHDPNNSNSTHHVGQLNYDYDRNGNKTREWWTQTTDLESLSNWDFDINNYDAEDRFLDFNRSGNSLNVALTFDRSELSAGEGTIGNIRNVSGTGNELIGARSYANTDTEQDSIVDGAHQLTQIGTNSQTFNFEGQLSVSHDGKQLQWDANGLLKEVTNGNDTYSYGYDCDGRRVWKKEIGDPAVTTFTVCTYGGPNCISEYTVDTTQPALTASSLERERVFGTTIDESLLVEISPNAALPSGKKLGVTRNHQWSITAAYDFPTGQVEQRYNYGVFGKRYLVNADGTYNPNATDPFDLACGYTSRRHDAESDLMYFRARVYDPTTGEFVSQDPLALEQYQTGYHDGMSLYRQYALIDGTDPSGLKKECKIKSAAPFTITQDCTLFKAGGVLSFGFQFQSKYEFEKPCCECCEYRQYTLGGQTIDVSL